LGDAVTLLTELAPHDGRVLAGGQSLVPIMAFRLAYPAHLIDINAIAGLDGLAVRNDKLCIGARVRHGDFHRPIDEGPLGALLAVVVRHIAHYPIRLRGTFCGSLAHADPAAEWCVVAATLNAELVALGAAGERRMAVHEFLRGALETALAPDELLLEARLPTLPDDTHFGFAEFSRRAGDYGLAMGPCGIPQVDRGPAREPDGGEPFAPAAPPCPRSGRVSRAILINSDISRRRAMASAE
jgi:carbon-monoxide dehydrogenase medium subunit